MTDPVPKKDRTAGDSDPAGRRQHASLDVAPELYAAGTPEARTSQQPTAQRRSISDPGSTTESR